MSFITNWNGNDLIIATLEEMYICTYMRAMLFLIYLNKNIASQAAHMSVQ